MYRRIVITAKNKNGSLKRNIKMIYCLVREYIKDEPDLNYGEGIKIEVEDILRGG